MDRLGYAEQMMGRCVNLHLILSLQLSGQFSSYSHEIHFET